MQCCGLRHCAASCNRRTKCMLCVMGCCLHCCRMLQSIVGGLWFAHICACLHGVCHLCARKGGGWWGCWDCRDWFGNVWKIDEEWWRYDEDSLLMSCVLFIETSIETICPVYEMLNSDTCTVISVYIIKLFGWCILLENADWCCLADPLWPLAFICSIWLLANCVSSTAVDLWGCASHVPAFESVAAVAGFDWRFGG